MAGPVNALIAGAAAPVTSATIYPQRVRDEQGVAHAQRVTGTGTFTMKVQGRCTAAAPWFTIDTFDQTQLDANGATAKVVALFPEMRLDLTAVGASTTISGWILE